ncbi:CMRF35-like molecule 8 [Oncorhynchus masou masou]|uniref:CMRF35-like molecule 8 n=1 Tax=Oncorhynchus masou masou TaxID=90313 RepID=UPI003183C522
MKILHVVSCCLLSALCVVESAGMNVKEVVGGHVTVGCSFTLARNNNKYFCKGTCSGRDILVGTKGSKTATQGRYSIEDNSDGVYVTIKNLMKSDSGTYWCGVERYGPDTYQEVHLTVTDASPETSTLTSRPHVPTTLPNLSTTSSNLSTTLSSTFKASGDISVGPSQRTVTPVVIMVCVSLTVLVVGLILLLIYKWRRDRTSSRPVTNPDTTTQDSTYQTLHTTTQDSTYQTLNKTTQDSTYQTLNTTTQESTEQTLNTTTQDSTYQTLNTTTQDSTYQTLNTTTQDSTY